MFPPTQLLNGLKSPVGKSISSEALRFRQRQTYSNQRVYQPTQSDELTRARHRAEQREAELYRELEIRRIEQERRRSLLEFQERERIAKEQLQRIRGNQ